MARMVKKYSIVRCMYLAGFIAVSALLLVEAEGSAQTIALNEMPFQYRPYAIAVGQRLQIHGKERITAEGTITYNREDRKDTLPIHVIWQQPLRIRLDENGSTTVFERMNERQQIPTGDSAKLIQMLLEDSVEGLIAIRQRSGQSKYVGSGYKLENAAPGAPCMDIIQTTYPDVFRGGQSIAKTFWFNSRTKLLGVVAYSLAGSSVMVVIDDWRDVQGDKLPFKIERWENGKMTMQLVLDSARVSAATADGILGGN